MMFFDRIEAAPADPILGITDAFKKDTRPEKINLGVGVYKNEKGDTPSPTCPSPDFPSTAALRASSSSGRAMTTWTAAGR